MGTMTGQTTEATRRMDATHDGSGDESEGGGRQEEGAAAAGEPGATERPAHGETPVLAVVLSLAALWFLQLTVWATGAAVALGVIVAGSPVGVVPWTGAVAPDGVEPRRGALPEVAPLPEGDRSPEPAPAPSPTNTDDGVWRLDGFADFSDARLSVSGEPGAEWSRSTASGHEMWVDGRCRLVSEVVALDGRPSGGGDAEASETLARSLGDVALGGVDSRSDPLPATVRLPLLRDHRSVELASVTLQPAGAQPGGVSFVAVSARASVDDGRAVVFALACIDTPVSQADALTRNLIARFHLDTGT